MDGAGRRPGPRRRGGSRARMAARGRDVARVDPERDDGRPLVDHISAEVRGSVSTRDGGSMRNVITVALGGGAGTRLYPLTQLRSKPAVPFGGKYRIIDVPLSNCLNSGLNRIYLLTQYNSASLNQHVGATYRFSQFSRGFVNVLAAEQTPGNERWFQGTADAVRQVMGHLESHGFDRVLIISGDQLYQMDFQHLLAAHDAAH